MVWYFIILVIFYINGIKYFGNLVGLQLFVDLFVCYQCQCGYEVMFICVIDEYGMFVELVVKKVGKFVVEYCVEMYVMQVQIVLDFGLFFDYFGWFLFECNYVLIQYFVGKLDENGWICEVEESQIYFIDDVCFLFDRYIEGICLNCGYDKVCGD